jgi:hypothetical protein
VPATPTIIKLTTVVQVEGEGEVAGNGMGKVQAKGKEQGTRMESRKMLGSSINISTR